MQKNIYFSCNAKYKKSTEKKIKIVEKFIVEQMLKDAVFSAELLTSHQSKTNKIKTKKIIKLLILNLIRAIHNNTELIVSLDNNTIRSYNINPRLFRLILDKLARMDYITIHKGFFHAEDKKGKRSRISANRIKDIIIKATTEYTEDVTVHLDSAKKVKVAENEKVKLTFKAVDSDTTWSCFRDITIINEWLSEYSVDELKNKKIKLKLNGSKIVNIEL